MMKTLELGLNTSLIYLIITSAFKVVIKVKQDCKQVVHLG